MSKVIISFDGLDKVIGNIEMIGDKAPSNIEKQVGLLARDTEKAWQQATPTRTGQLRSADKAQAQGMSFTLQNAVHYYPFVDEGHNTPAGFRTRRGYRPAKRRSHVQGKQMTDAAIQFVEQNILNYLSKFLDNV